MKTTFWNLLKEQKIEIPIIQRDYAQGRIGKEKLRKKFLENLKKALEEKKTLKLDFVYGSSEKGSFLPLDGQQRLTTLWLLHWYIAFKSGNLTNNKDIFKKFTYETRVSSREFCNRLSEIQLENTEGNIVEIIRNQTWFFSEWEQDPTIQAMLNMLGGLEDQDGIEKVFRNVTNYQAYWDLLTGDDCPIVFYSLSMEDFSLSDDLYIKMNARGKQLTDFENFKAELVKYIKKYEPKENPQEFFSKMDTVWADLFWKYKSPEYKTDEIYFAFFNRYLLNKFITTTTSSIQEITTTELFNYLYPIKEKGQEDNEDTNIKFQTFDIYRSDAKLKEHIGALEKILDELYRVVKDQNKDEINKMFFPDWDENSTFRFIPEYINNNKITTLSQTHRAVFHAVCCYFEKGTYNETSFKQWMRVVWNIVENADINNKEAMIGAIRLIDSLAKHSHNIYAHLKDRNISNDFSQEQMKEEKEKASKIVSNPEWEDKIIEAEKYAFFKGAIRFLFRTKEDTYDWEKFDKRLEKAKLYFDKNGVKEEFQEKAILLRSFISYFDQWAQFWFWKYDHQATSWKPILTAKKWIEPVNKLLDNDLPDLSNWNSPLKDIEQTTEKKIKAHEDLVRSLLLSKIEDKCRLHYKYNKYVLYPCNSKIQKNKYVIADERNEILSKLIEDGIIESEQKIAGIPFFGGWNIEFKLKNKECKKVFRWKREDKLVIVGNNGKEEEIKGVSLENLREYLENRVDC